MNIWHDVDPETIKPEDFDAAIEIPKGSNCKYELDKYTGLLRLDRVLYTSVWTGYCIPHRTIRQITDSFPAPMRMTETRWTCWCFVPRQFIP